VTTATLRWNRQLRDYAQLMRLHRPIGILLLLWPMLWALWIASAGRPDPTILLIFVLGTIVMRSAGCIVNDLVDRDFDPHVKRTRDRPLAARRISPYEAIVLFVLLMATALLLVAQLDEFTIRLSVLGAALTITYPFFKRFFPAPQIYLGLAFGWGVPMAFAAQAGSLPRVAWLLLMAAVVWATIYDTEYAMVDRDDDRALGLKSTAILFGEMDRLVIGALQAMMLFALLLVGRLQEFGLWFGVAVAVAAALFAYQQWLMRVRDRDGCFRAFLNNNIVGLAIFCGIAAQYALPR
jgi:4-hydroxybenzoate polyprenyltransferase